MEAHASRIATGKPFAISVKTMAAARTAAPLGVARMRAARDCLIAADVLRVVHTGGRCPGDVSLYRFGELAWADAISPVASGLSNAHFGRTVP